jgi:transposase
MVTRRQFSREFKIEAVNLVTERGVAASQAAKGAPPLPACRAS